MALQNALAGIATEPTQLSHEQLLQMMVHLLDNIQSALGYPDTAGRVRVNVDSTTLGTVSTVTTVTTLSTLTNQSQMGTWLTGMDVMSTINVSVGTGLRSNITVS